MAQDIKERYINPYTDFGFQKLFDQAEIAKYTDAERRQYEESKKVFWDNYSVIKTARDKGWKEGRTAGIEETASKMKYDGMSAELISKYTGLSVEDIVAL